MAETISTIITYALAIAFIAAHVAVFAWGLSLAKPESRRAVGVIGVGLAAILLSVAGCSHYIAR